MCFRGTNRWPNESFSCRSRQNINQCRTCANELDFDRPAKRAQGEIAEWNPKLGPSLRPHPSRCTICKRKPLLNAAWFNLTSENPLRRSFLKTDKCFKCQRLMCGSLACRQKHNPNLCQDCDLVVCHICFRADFIHPKFPS